MRRRIDIVDVFGTGPLTGNPVAVVLDGAGLGTAQMQQLTRWLDFSETTFLLAPTDAAADYRVRIFTLAGELPFAGHPTLGSCHAWLAAGNRPRGATVVQECGAGLVQVRTTEHGLAFAAPPLVRSGALDAATLERITGVLGIGEDEVVDAAWVDNGPGWAGVLLRDAQRVLDLTPDLARAAGGGRIDIGVAGLHTPGQECALEVRAFFSGEHGELREDPVTGSLNASLAQWLTSSGRLDAPYIACQGTCLGRAGRVHIERDDDGTVWVGGSTSTIVEGGWHS